MSHSQVSGKYVLWSVGGGDDGSDEGEAADLNISAFESSLAYFTFDFLTIRNTFHRSIVN